jgi:hypothetical protein
VWGKKLAPPRQGGRWPGDWQTGKAFIYTGFSEKMSFRLKAPPRLLNWSG